MSGQSFTAFDANVLKAMERWPDVPECRGWLALDRRGRWRIRGALIEHARAVEFLSRHYAKSDDGCWYVQNGPQVVLVDLEYTPWIYRLSGDGAFVSHTGLDAGMPQRCLVDEEGNVLIDTKRGPGLIDDRDLVAVSEFLQYNDPSETYPDTLVFQQCTVPVDRISRADVASRFDYTAQPGDVGMTEAASDES